MIAFALPSIFLLPWLSGVFGLSDAVAGAWNGVDIVVALGLAVVLFGHFTVG